MNGGTVMKTKDALRGLAAALVLPLLLGTFGCDSDPGGKEYPPADQDEQFQIDCSLSPTTSEMVFAASGAIMDEGTVVGEPTPWSINGEGPERWSGIRTFRGQLGNIEVFVVAENSQPDAAIARGDFQVLRGTAQYTDLVADGEFEVTLDGDGRMGESFKGVLTNDR